MAIQADTDRASRNERWLATYNAIAQVLANASTLEDVTPRILRILCEYLDWVHGAIWRVDRAAKVLRCVDTWHRPSVNVGTFDDVTRQMTFAPGIGMPGRVWSTRQPAWIENVVEDANFPRALVAATMGLRAACGFPLMLDNDVVGVLEFFSRTIEPPDDELLQRFMTVGTLIGLFLKRAEAERQIVKERNAYKRLLDELPAPIWKSGLDARCDYVNQSWLAFTGRRLEQQVGDGWTEDVHPEDRRQCRADYLEAFRERAPFELSYRLRRHDGVYRTVVDTRRPLYDGDGNFTGFIGAIYDLTTRKQAEALLQSLLESAPDGTVVTDHQGVIRFVNAQIEKLFGYCSKELIGQTVELLVPDRLRTGHIAQRVSLPLAGDVYVMGKGRRLAARRKDGSEFQVEIALGRVQSPEDPLMIANVRDISDRISLEEQFRQSQKMEAIGQLAGGIAHDFNNLLTVITGHSQMLLPQLAEGTRIRKGAEEIAAAGERAAALTSQLLAFACKQMLSPCVFNVNTVLAGMEGIFRRLLGEQISLRVCPAQDLGRVKADRNQLEQVLLNLAVNARDAMPDGGRLTIETANVLLDDSYARSHVDVQPGPCVMLAVSDTGMGMDADTRARLFEPFFTTKALGRGTGLGLSIVYGSVKQNGGHIWVYSEPGRGTTFKVYLPQTDEAEAMPSRTGSAIRGGTETILVVEDEAQVRDLAKMVLEERGYTVLVAPHGREALAICQDRREPIHLLVTDVVMPDIVGRALALRLKAHWPMLKVLCISGYTENAIVHHGVLDEGVALLQKPFSPAALAREVRTVLDAGPSTI